LRDVPPPGDGRGGGAAARLRRPFARSRDPGGRDSGGREPGARPRQAGRLLGREGVPGAGQVRHPRLARPALGPGKPAADRFDGVTTMAEMTIPESHDTFVPAHGKPSRLTDPALQLIEQQVVESLRSCYDPEIPVNIYELGLIYD